MATVRGHSSRAVEAYVKRNCVCHSGAAGSRASGDNVTQEYDRIPTYSEIS